MKLQSVEKLAADIYEKLGGDPMAKPTALEHTMREIYGLIVPSNYGGISVADGVAVQTIEGAGAEVEAYIEHDQGADRQFTLAAGQLTLIQVG